MDQIELTLDNPADCANKLLTGQVDLGLVPVAVIPSLNNARIVSNFCIGANGPVETVCLFSEVPLSEVRSILLDYQSRTSVQLVRYLASNAWKISPEWKQADIHFIDQIQGDTAGVVIGDRAFGLHEKFPTVIDLSQEWKKHTDLPFVFACWVSNRNLPESFLSTFNDALQFGLDNRQTAVKELPTYTEHDLERYVQDVISYDLDEKKLTAMKLFLDWMSKSD